jgi:hypothetical protein
VRHRPYERGVRTALERVGLKTATAPEMGNLQVSEAFTPATGDSGQTMGRTNENPQAQVNTAFNEFNRQWLLEPNETTLLPVGGNRSMNTKMADVTPEQLQSLEGVPAEPNAHARRTGGGFYARNKQIGFDPNAKDLVSILAHERAHEDIDRHPLGAMLQHPAMRAPHYVAPLLSVMAARSSKKYGPMLGAGVGALASAPTLTSEGLAHYKAYKKLQELGASDAQLQQYVGTALPAMGSYLAMPAVSAALGGIAHNTEFGPKLGAHKLDRRLKFRDFDISIETDEGHYRYWYDKAAQQEGKTLMKYPYGYIRMTEGMDGDHVDCFVGPKEDADTVYVITTNKAPDFKVIDEQKCMLGFTSPEAAKAAFMEHYDKPGFFRSMKAMSYADFKSKVFATKGVGKKIATNTYETDDNLIENAQGPSPDQVPGDFLGMPFRSRMLGYHPVVGGNPAQPLDRIDRMFRHHDEAMDTRVMEGTPDGIHLDPGV